MVGRSSPSNTNRSSPALIVKSSICTSPLYRKEEFLKKKDVEERLSARQIAFLIGCSHHAVNQALKRFGLAREISSRGRLGFEVGRSPRGRIYDKQMQRLVALMIRLRDNGTSYREIARRLELKGIKAPSGNVKWYGGTIRSILKRSRFQGQ